MSPTGTASILQLIVCGGLGLASAVAWPHVWSGRRDEQLDQALRVVWPYGAPSRRGFARTAPLSFAVMIVLGVTMVLHAPVIVDHAPAVAIAAEYVGGVLILGSLVMFYTVMAFNKPKFIVASHRRSEPGVSEERQAAWRERQQGQRSQSDPAAGDPRGGAQTGRPGSPP
jgi:hypothetical protein